MSTQVRANALNKGLTTGAGSAPVPGFLVGTFPSLIAPDALSVSVPLKWLVLKDPAGPPNFEVTLTLYVVLAVSPPNETTLELA